MFNMVYCKGLARNPRETSSEERFRIIHHGLMNKKSSPDESEELSNYVEQ